MLPTRDRGDGETQPTLGFALRLPPIDNLSVGSGEPAEVRPNSSGADILAGRSRLLEKKKPSAAVGEGLWDTEAPTASALQQQRGEARVQLRRRRKIEVPVPKKRNSAAKPKIG